MLESTIPTINQACGPPSSPLFAAHEPVAPKPPDLRPAVLYDNSLGITMVKETPNWSTLEDSEIEFLLTQEFKMNPVTNQGLNEPFRDLTSGELLEELNAICSKWDKIEPEEFSSTPRPIATNSFVEHPTFDELWGELKINFSNWKTESEKYHSKSPNGEPPTFDFTPHLFNFKQIFSRKDKIFSSFIITNMIRNQEILIDNLLGQHKEALTWSIGILVISILLVREIISAYLTRSL